MKANCPLCNKESNHLYARWMDYDSEDQYIAWICKDCIEADEKSKVRK